MDVLAAVESMGALGQETRLRAFRLLVEAGEEGVPAGEIARRLDVPHNTMSSHLAQLARAGLIRSRRESRSVIYVADFAGIRALLAFLVEDCCRGRSEACGPLLDAALPLAACCPAPQRPSREARR